MRAVIVGGSLAGLRSAEALRDEGFTGQIVVIGAEWHEPYNRPPLSKSVLTAPGGGSAQPLPRDSDADIEWRLGQPVVECDLERAIVTTADGGTLGFDYVVAATGLRPRRLPVGGPAAGRYVLRTIEDARALAGELRRDARVVVVGAGFIGCEIASTARLLGCRVTVVAPERVPMEQALGPILGAAMQRRHELAGVEFRMNSATLGFDGRDKAERVLLGDGTELVADVVIEAIGCVPQVEWLAGNGLDLTDGVLCDGSLRAAGTERLFAAGDVARFPIPLLDAVPRRFEHWTMADESARHVARAIVTDGSMQPFAPLPSFWTDQQGIRVQGYGMPSLADSSELVTGHLEGDVIVEYRRAGSRIGLAGIGHRRELRALAQALTPAKDELS
jgi:3-phenylpropionate/trans-cinnamate dioxygenase ferredoxin reductase subunit